MSTKTGWYLDGHHEGCRRAETCACECHKGNDSVAKEVKE